MQSVENIQSSNKENFSQLSPQNTTASPPKAPIPSATEKQKQDGAQLKITLVPLDAREAINLPKTVATGMRLIGKKVFEAMREKNIPVVHAQVFWKIENSSTIQMSFCIGRLPSNGHKFGTYANTVIADALRQKFNSLISKGLYLESIIDGNNWQIATSENLSSGGYITLFVSYASKKNDNLTIEPEKNDVPKARVRLIANQRASGLSLFAEEIFSESATNPLFLEKLIGGTLFPAQIVNTKLEGNNQYFLWVVVIAALHRFCSDIINLDGDDQRHFNDIAKAIEECSAIDKRRDAALQSGGEELLTFCQDLMNDLFKLSPGESLTIQVGYSDVGVAHSSYVIYKCSADGQAFEVYEIGGYSLDVISGGNGYMDSHGVKTAPAHYYLIPKDKLFPIIGQSENTKDVRSVAHLFLMLKLKNFRAQNSQGYRKFLSVIWHNFAEYKYAIPQHMVGLFVRAPNSGICTISSLECLLLVQFAMRFENPKDACNLVRLFFFYISMQAVEADCNYHSQHSDAFAEQNYEILFRARNHLIFQKNKLGKMKNDLAPEENCPTVLRELADGVVAKIDKLLNAHRDVIQKAFPPPMPLLKSANLTKIGSDLRQIFKVIYEKSTPSDYKFLRAPTDMTLFPLWEQNNKNLKERVIDYLSRFAYLPGQVVLHSIAMHCLPMPGDEIWENFNGEEARKAFDHILKIKNAYYKVWNCPYGATERFFIINVLFKLLIKREFFFSDVLKKYCVDDYIFKSIALRDNYILGDRDEINIRDRLLEFSKKECENGKIPTFFLYDGIGGTGKDGAWPITAEMQLWEEIFDVAAKIVAEKKGRGEEDSFCRKYDSFFQLANWHITNGEIVPNACKNWTKNLQISGAMFNKNPEIISAIEEFGRECREGNEITNLLSLCKYCRMFEHDTFGTELHERLWHWDPSKQIFCFDKNYEAETSLSSTKKSYLQHEVEKLNAENTALSKGIDATLSIFEPLEAEPSLQVIAILQDFIQNLNKYFAEEKNQAQWSKRNLENLRKVLFKTLIDKDGHEIHPMLDTAKKDGPMLMKLTQELWNAIFYNFYVIPPKKDMQTCVLCLILISEIRLSVAKEHREMLGDPTFALVCELEKSKVEPIGDFLRQRLSDAEGKCDINDIQFHQAIHMILWCDSLFCKDRKQMWKELFFIGLLNWNKYCMLKNLAPMIFSELQLHPPQPSDIKDILGAVSDILDTKYEEKDVEWNSNLLRISKDNVLIDLFTWKISKEGVLSIHPGRAFPYFRGVVREIFDDISTTRISKVGDNDYFFANEIFNNVRFRSNGNKSVESVPFLRQINLVERMDGNGNVLWRAITKKHAKRLVPPAVLLDATAWINKNGDLEICDHSNGTPLFRTDSATGKLRKLLPPFAGTFVEIPPLEINLKTWDDEEDFFDLPEIAPEKWQGEDLFSCFEAPEKYYFVVDKNGKCEGVIFPYYRDASGQMFSLSCDGDGKWHSGSYVVDTVPAMGNPLGTLGDALVLRHVPHTQDAKPLATIYILPSAQICYDQNSGNHGDGKLRNRLKFRLQIDETQKRILQCYERPGGGLYANDMESIAMLAYVNLAQCNYGEALAQLGKINFLNPLGKGTEKIIVDMCCIVYEHDSSAYAAAVALYGCWMQMKSKKEAFILEGKTLGEVSLTIGILTKLFRNYLLDMENVPWHHRLTYQQELDLLQIQGFNEFFSLKRKQALFGLHHQNLKNLSFLHGGRKYTLMGASPNPQGNFRAIYKEEVDSATEAFNLFQAYWRDNDNFAFMAQYEFKNICAKQTCEKENGSEEELNGKPREFAQIYEDLRLFNDDSVEIQKRDIVFHQVITEAASFSDNTAKYFPIMMLALKIAAFYGPAAPTFPNPKGMGNNGREWIREILRLANEYVSQGTENISLKFPYRPTGPRIPSAIRFYENIERNSEEDDMLAAIDRENRQELAAFNFSKFELRDLEPRCFQYVLKLREFAYGATFVPLLPPSPETNHISIPPNDFHGLAKYYLEKELEIGAKIQKLHHQRIRQDIHNLENLIDKCANCKQQLEKLRDKAQKRLLQNLNDVVSGNRDDIIDFRHGELLRPLTVTDAIMAAASYYATLSFTKNQAILSSAMVPLRRLNPGINLDKSDEIFECATVYAKINNEIAAIDRISSHVHGIMHSRHAKDISAENFHRDRLFQEFCSTEAVGNLSPSFCVLFEYLNGNIRLREEQIQALNFSMSVIRREQTISQTKGVLQLRMGMGKTDIILPFLLFCVTVGKRQNARLCVDDTQMAAVQLQMEDRLSNLGLRLFTMPSMPDEWSDSKQLTHVLEIIRENAVTHDIVFLQSAMSYRVMLNVYKKLLLAPQTEKLWQLAEILRSNFVEIVDEVHLSYSPYVSFASTAAGGNQRIENAMESVAHALIFHIATAMKDDTGICENDQSARFNAKKYNDTIRPQLIEYILKYFSSLKEYYGTVQRRYDFIKNFLAGMEISNDESPSPDENFEKILWYTRTLLDKYIPDILRRKCGTDYGLDEKGERCVPYEKGQRSHGYFRDPITETMLSAAMAIQLPVDESRLVRYVKQCINDATIERMHSANEFSKTDAAENFFRVTNVRLKVFTDSTTDINQLVSMEYKEKLKGILGHLNGNDQLPKMDNQAIKARLEIYKVTSKCIFHTQFYEVNSSEIPLRSYRVLAMSGTPNNLSACPPEMEANLHRDPGAIGKSIFTFLEDLRNKNTISFVVRSRSAKAIFSDYVMEISRMRQKGDLAQSICGILDMGALLPADMEQNAREIWEIIHRDMPYDGILFWNNKTSNFAILRSTTDLRSTTNRNVTIPIRSIRDEDLSSAGIHDKRRLFIIYDQSHCTGMNIVGLRTDARMLLLAEPISMTSDFLAQTLMRLRLYGIGGQHIDIAFSEVALDTWRQSSQKEEDILKKMKNLKLKIAEFNGNHHGVQEGAMEEEIKEILIANDTKRRMQIEERCVYNRCIALCHSFLLNISLGLGFSQFNHAIQIQIGQIFQRNETFTALEDFKNSPLSENRIKGFEDFYHKNLKRINALLPSIQSFYTSDKWQMVYTAFSSEIHAISKKAHELLPSVIRNGRGFGGAEEVYIEQNVEHLSEENKLLAAKLKQQQQMEFLQQQLMSFRVQARHGEHSFDMGEEVRLFPPTEKTDFSTYIDGGMCLPVRAMFNDTTFAKTSEQAKKYQEYGALFHPQVKATFAFALMKSGSIPVFSQLMRRCYAFAQGKNGNIVFLTLKQAVSVRENIECGLFSGVRLYATAGWGLLAQSKDVQPLELPMIHAHPLRFYVSLFNGDYETIFRERSYLEIDLSKHEFSNHLDADRLSELFAEFIRLRSEQPVSIRFDFSEKQLEPLKK